MQDKLVTLHLFYIQLKVYLKMHNIRLAIYFSFATQQTPRILSVMLSLLQLHKVAT